MAEQAGLFNRTLFSTLNKKVFAGEYLNEFMSLSRAHWREARETLQSLFAAGSALANNQELLNKLVAPSKDILNHLPAKIGDYTDFYSSRAHAFNVGSIIRGPANALNENWVGSFLFSFTSRSVTMAVHRQL